MPVGILLVVGIIAQGCGFDRSRVDGEKCAQFPCAPGCAATCDPDAGGLDAPNGTDPDSIADQPVADDCPGSENACGGCGVLAGGPGERCAESTCGTYVCSGGAVVCVAGEVNGCGGCEPLTGSPNDPCGGGSCGATLQCDGPDLLACSGPVPDVCGGCSANGSVELASSCGCDIEVDESHTWQCDGTDLLCGNGNGTIENPTQLPDSDDSNSEYESYTGALVTGDTEDFFEMLVVDELGGDGMLPDVELTGLTRDLDLCAYWEYVENGRPPNIECASGGWIQDGNTEGCCSNNGGTSDELVSLRGNAWGIERLDPIIGGDNDNGIITIRVYGAQEAGCSPYTINFRF